MQFGNATVSVGGGTAILTLPDIPSFVTRNANVAGATFISGFKFSDDFDDEIGWNINGSIQAPMGANTTVSLNGFWANIDDKDSARCDHGPGIATACTWFALVDDPTVSAGGSQSSAPGDSIISNADREVDQWGVSLEAQRQLPPTVSGVTQAPPRRFLAVGADARGIDQDLDVALRWITPNAIGPATYAEDLDTRYYGAYVAWGGDINPFLFKGLWQRWGLHSTFKLRGGIYYADTDYSGRIVDQTAAPFSNISSALSLSEDDVAFIGGLVTETSKRLGKRALLSLRSEYEYYSYVPEMAYNTVNQNAAGIAAGAGGQLGTVINDDDAFGARTSLRLTIKLGPDELFREPIK